MSLLTTIQNLSVEPRHDEDEYEYTSDFLEWFYYNIYREKNIFYYVLIIQVIFMNIYQHYINMQKNVIVFLKLVLEAVYHRGHFYMD